MSFEEKSTWVSGVLFVVLPVDLLAIVLPQLSTTPVADIDYQWPMLVTIGAGDPARPSWASSSSPSRPPGRPARLTSATRTSDASASTWAGRCWARLRDRAVAADPRRGRPLLDREQPVPGLPARRGHGHRGQDLGLPPGHLSHGQADPRHQQHPRAPLRERRDDPGGAGRPHRRHPPDDHRHRAGALLALAGDGLPDRARLRAAPRRRLPVPRRAKERPHEGHRPGTLRTARRGARAARGPGPDAGSRPGASSGPRRRPSTSATAT